MFCELEANSAEHEREPVWVLDSGATKHVTGNANLIVGVKPYACTFKKIAAGGEPHKMAGQGDFLVKFTDGEMKAIRNVQYVPRIRRNLLSIECIADQGYLVEFSKDACAIREKGSGEILCSGIRMRGRGIHKLKVECLTRSAP